jgi:large subunit ribosomal protein L4
MLFSAQKALLAQKIHPALGKIKTPQHNLTANFLYSKLSKNFVILKSPKVYEPRTTPEFSIDWTSKSSKALDIIKSDYKDLCIITESSEYPIVERVPEKLLVENWWAQKPFSTSKPLNVPIMNFATGEYSGKQIELDKNIFNNPLRRDLIHRAFRYERFRGITKTHVGKNLNTVAGSNRKRVPQKKARRARQGHIRAPRMRGGVLAHPRKMQIMEEYPLPMKVKLQALKALLSARLAEGKIRIIDSETCEEAKTKIVRKCLEKMTLGCRERFLLVTGYTVCENFKLAERNLQYIRRILPNVIFFVNH